MSRPENFELQWRKSSHSSGNGQCLEVAYAGAIVATRDSKDSAGPALLFGTEAWKAFVAEISEGGFPSL